MGEYQGAAITLWRRESELYLARPDGQAEQRLATGRNPAVALRKTGVYAVWSTPEGIMAAVPGKPAYVLAKSGVFPAITGQGPVIAAWEDKGRIVTQLLEP